MDGAPQEAPEDASKRGFRKGLNVGLAAVALCCALWAMLWPFFEVPRHVDVYKQIMVPMPGLTMLVVEFYPFVSIGLMFGAAGCVLATRGWGERRQTVFVNGGFLLLCLAWILLYKTALGLPMMSLLEGIGQRRH